MNIDHGVPNRQKINNEYVPFKCETKIANIVSTLSYVHDISNLSQLQYNRPGIHAFTH